MLAVGAWRGRRIVAFVAHEFLAVVARAQLPTPEFLPGGTDAKEIDILAVFAGQKNVIAPDSRRRAPHARHLERPGDVFGRAPGGWQSLFVANAVHGGAAPLRPI